MIQSFGDIATEDIYEGRDSKVARRKCPAAIWPIARRKLDQLDAVIILTDMRAPPGNRLDALKGNRAGQHSIRINQQYRICFTWTTSGPSDVVIVDYH